LRNSLFQSFKCLLLGLTPQEFRALLAQSVKGRRHVGKPGYKLMVKIYHAYEATNVSNVAGSREIADRSRALMIDAHAGWRNQVSQERVLLRGKYHFLRLNCQVGHSEVIQV
jgi:hypothetical protein